MHCAAAARVARLGQISNLTTLAAARCGQGCHIGREIYPNLATLAAALAKLTGARIVNSNCTSLLPGFACVAAAG